MASEKDGASETQEGLAVMTGPQSLDCDPTSHLSSCKFVVAGSSGDGWGCVSHLSLKSGLMESLKEEINWPFLGTDASHWGVECVLGGTVQPPRTIGTFELCLITTRILSSIPWDQYIQIVIPLTETKPR